MGTDPTGPGGGTPGTPGGAMRPGTGSMHPSYPDPGPPRFVRRHPRLSQWVLAAILVVFQAGLGLLGRHVIVDDDRWLPAGPGLAQVGLDMALLVVGGVMTVRGLAAAVRSPSRPAHGLVTLPRCVRRAVWRRETVPESYRADVLAWLDGLLETEWTGVAWPMVSMAGVYLALNAYSDDSWTEVLVISGGFLAAYFLFIGTPVALFHRWLTRTHRHYASPPP